MADELTVMKRADGVLVPVAPIDMEIVKNWKAGRAYKVKAVKMNDRGLKFHQFYWCGLVALAMEYWTPAGGLIGAAEKGVLKNVVKYVDKMGYESEGVKNLFRGYLEFMKQTRADKIHVPHKSEQAFHKWIKEEIGLFEWTNTPSGMKKEVGSINFNKMNEEQFRAFYKQAFTVCWNFILSKTFESEEQAQNAVDQLLNLG